MNINKINPNFLLAYSNKICLCIVVENLVLHNDFLPRSTVLFYHRYPINATNMTLFKLARKRWILESYIT